MAKKQAFSKRSLLKLSSDKGFPVLVSGKNRLKSVPSKKILPLGKIFVMRGVFVHDKDLGLVMAQNDQKPCFFK